MKSNVTGAEATDLIPVVIIARNMAIVKRLKSILDHEGKKSVHFSDPFDFCREMKGTTRSVVFLESGFVREYGRILYERLFRVCPFLKIVLVCSPEDRDLIKEAMENGVYGCVVEPFDAWEVSTMLRHLLADLAFNVRKVE
ncbi:response regulator [Thermodesulforhabdus norvegica]|uniref:Response regulator receiver domain-containing protein n=1 Tax=Thermodesulforhabdus norvegica TaxID=39841 RepID=A0A1I4TRN0_9BACT|nr:response regulator [Thermodesulforhabdus norvegica]SFM79250.1 Response regulator receiver domain-containing protein [Thermodesulforhabdus norvegica]